MTAQLCPACGLVMDGWLTQNGYTGHVLCEGKESRLDRSRRERDEAMARVDEHAPLAWKDEARHFLWRRILSREPFTTDDLWDDGLPKPREPRALGPIVAAAKRKGYLADTGRMVQSRYRHATKITVWQGTP